MSTKASEALPHTEVLLRYCVYKKALLMSTVYWKVFWSILSIEDVLQDLLYVDGIYIFTLLGRTLKSISKVHQSTTSEAILSTV